MAHCVKSAVPKPKIEGKGVGVTYILPDMSFIQTCVLVRAICVKNESHTVFLLSQGCSSNKVVGDRGIRPLMVACFINIKERNRNFQDIVQVQSQSRTRRQLWPKYLDVYLHLEP